MQETQDTWVPSLCQEDPLEKEMATHSTEQLSSHVAAWRVSLLWAGLDYCGQFKQHCWAEKEGGGTRTRTQGKYEISFLSLILNFLKITREIWEWKQKMKI